MIRSGIIILEGPDGGGKTTLAKRLALEMTDLGANVITIHNGPYHGVKDDLARLYAEAMMPAILGEAVVIMDRSWISEPIYGNAFRGGIDRIGRSRRRMLERLVLRAAHLVICCLPSWETCRENFMKRKKLEYLDTEDQLYEVYNVFHRIKTPLRRCTYNYEIGVTVEAAKSMIQIVDIGRFLAHPHSWPSAGRLDAPLRIVGDTFPNIHDGDTRYQWPFGSFSGAGASKWLTERIDDIGFPEDSLFWINADADDSALLSALTDQRFMTFALGTKAAERLQNLGIRHIKMPSPMGWKRGGFSEAYPLIKYLGKHK